MGADAYSCACDLVNVLVSGLGHVAYLVFDCKELVNEAAMTAVAGVPGTGFNSDDEDAA